MSVPKATLGGTPLTLQGGFKWGLQYGVAPHQHTFATTRAFAQKILAKQGPITLSIHSAGYPALRVRKLYVLQPSAVDENNLGIVVADVRWLLTRKSVTRDYNIRRTTGDARRVGNELQPMQTQNVLGDLIYRRSSLNEGAKWTATDILGDILTELVGADGFKIGTTQFSIDVESLVLDKDRGDAALSRVLSYLPGARVYVGLDGILQVVNSLDGSEATALKAAGPRYRSMPGQVELIDRSRLRPSNVKVLFEPEPEIRFNYDEDSPDPSRVAGREPRILENVIPVVDPTVTLDGKTITQGTWLTLQDWITAVNAKADTPNRSNGVAAPPLSMDLLRVHYMNGYQLLRILYVGAHYGAADVLWERRFKAIEDHFRQTFRVLPQWMDKLRRIIPARSSILDQETGSRGKAEAFFDHFVVARKRNYLIKGPEHDKSVGHDVEGYADDLDGQGSSPAEIVIIDEQAGVFRLNFRLDLWGDGVRLAPGLIVDSAKLLLKQIATHNPTMFSSLAAKLATGWKLAVVMSASTAVPNNSSRLYAVDVGTATAYAQLGEGIAVPSKATGPEWTIGISAGVDTARFMWSDTDSAELEGHIYGDSPWDNKFLTNGNTINAIANATAARVHSLLLDRWEGAQFVRFNPSIVPTGSMSTVSHAIMSNGAAVTHMMLPPVLQAPDLYSMMPDGARKILQRQVQQ